MPYDVIVLGCGGIGSAALYQLARRGVRALGIDRFPPAHALGSSHGQSRIIRQAYFEHLDYVPLLLRAYEGWRELEERQKLKLYYETGLLEVGPPDGYVVSGVLKSAEKHNLAVDQLTPREVAARFPGFAYPESMSAVLERHAGFLRVEACVQAHLDGAQSLGAELRTEETVRSWHVEGSSVVVETDRGTISGNKLIVTAGAWAGPMLADLKIPLTVRRKPLFWFERMLPSFAADHGAPCFLFETMGSVFYGFPDVDDHGVKVAEHEGGRDVTDPLTVDRELDPVDEQRVRAFADQHLPGVIGRRTDHAVCMYTMTPDAHFIVDVHPGHPQVALAAGFSGHGFKFCPAMGEAVAELALEGRTALPIGFLGMERAALHPSR